MTRKELRNAIQKHRGPIIVPVLVKEDVIYMPIKKADIVWQLTDRDDDNAPWDILEIDGSEMILTN